MPWPDLLQCEAEKLNGSFMTLGPRSLERCTRAPDFVITSKPIIFDKKHEDAPAGQMSMCAECFGVFRTVAKPLEYTYVRLLDVKLKAVLDAKA